MASTSKSSYGARKAMGQGSGRSGSSSAGTDTTHSVYTLIKDEAGNVVDKQYINSVFAYENEGKFGPILALNITEDLPAGRVYITRKKGK